MSAAVGSEPDIPVKGSADERASSKAPRKDQVSDTDASYAEVNSVEKVLEDHRHELDELFDQFGHDEPDRIVLYRFLKAFKFDMTSVKSRLSDTIAWRARNDFSSVRAKAVAMAPSEFPHATMIHRFIPEVVDYSRDRDGNVVGIVHVGHIRPNELEAHVTPEEILEYQMYSMASVANLLAELTKQTSVVTRVTRIIDLEGLGMRHVSASMLKYIRLLLSTAQAHFVELMAHAIIINAPSAFTVVWKLIKPLLHERTVRKVVICGSNYLDVLDKFMDRDAVPQYLGGTCCKPFHLPNHNEGFQRFVVPRGGRHVQEVYVPGSGSEVSWQFRTKGHDIGFAAEFRADGDAASVSPVDEVARATSHKHTVMGSFVNENGPGTLHLIFDNSYSRWTAKLVKLRVAVDGVCQTSDS